MVSVCIDWSKRTSEENKISSKIAWQHLKHYTSAEFFCRGRGWVTDSWVVRFLFSFGTKVFLCKPVAWCTHRARLNVAGPDFDLIKGGKRMFRGSIGLLFSRAHYMVFVYYYLEVDRNGETSWDQSENRRKPRANIQLGKNGWRRKWEPGRWPCSRPDRSHIIPASTLCCKVIMERKWK